MGISIGKVFRPIEDEIRKLTGSVDSFYMPIPDYSISGLVKNILATRDAVKSGKYDIVHITGSEHYLIPFIKKLGAKIVVTVHDLGFYTNHRDKKLRALWKKLLWINTLKYADQIVCISEKTKSEVESLVNVKSKICVVNDPVGCEFEYTPKTINRDKPVILQVGTKSNKNIERVIESLRGLNCRLVIIGPLNDKHKALLTQCDVDYENKVGISDEELLAEYINCDIVSLPSLYEGFGVPILEGQAIGRVVVTSDVSPMKEVAGGGAILVAPSNIESIRKGFVEAIFNWDRYVSLGLLNAQKYSIKQISFDYLYVYKKYANSILVK